MMKDIFIITKRQEELMLHALGLETGDNIDKSYHNRFYTNTMDMNWGDLVRNGFAEKSKGYVKNMAFFHVTDKGIKHLRETRCK